jgi:nucleoid DNA-binding protein
VVVIGDPSTNAGVAPVDATNGLAVDVKTLPASTNTIEVVGDAAEDAAVAGNPVLTGGRYDATPRTLDDGDVGAIALDADGAVQISDGGNTITVDGTVTANLSATDNAVLDTIDAVLDTINAKLVSGTVIGDVNLGATDNAVLDNIQTAVELIDDTVATLGTTTYTEATTKGSIVGAVRNDTLGALANTDNEVAPLQVNASGALYVDGSDTTQPVSGTVTANLSATDNAVLDTIDAVLDTINAKLVSGTVIGDVNLGATDNAVLDAIQADTAAIKTAVEILDNAIAGNEMQVDIVSGSSSNTEYNEDAATPATIAGGALMMERDDALGTLTPIEGDWAGARCSAEGALWVQEFNSDAILADTANMDTNLGTVAGAVSGSEMQVDVVAALPAGTNAIGKLAANSGVDIGDVDVTTVPTCLQGDGNPTIDSITHASINVAAGASNSVLVSSAANKQIWVYSIMLTANVAGTVSIQDEDDTAITGVVQLGATGGYSVSPSGNFAMPIWKLGTDKDLEMDTVTCEVDGFLTYALVSV